MNGVFSLSFFLPGYFSPRRGYGRVMKLYVGSKLTNILRFQSKKIWEPHYPLHYASFGWTREVFSEVVLEFRNFG
jgi:hypothetical protein